MNKQELVFSVELHLGLIPYPVSAKNENGAQKNTRIFKSNAPTWLKLGVGLYHMYTNCWNFLDLSV